MYFHELVESILNVLKVCYADTFSSHLRFRKKTGFEIYFKDLKLKIRNFATVNNGVL